MLVAWVSIRFKSIQFSLHSIFLTEPHADLLGRKPVAWELSCAGVPFQHMAWSTSRFRNKLGETSFFLLVAFPCTPD